MYVTMLSEPFRRFLDRAKLAPVAATLTDRVHPKEGQAIYMQEPFDSVCGAFSIVECTSLPSGSRHFRADTAASYLCRVLLNRPSGELMRWLAEEVKIQALLDNQLNYIESPYLAPVILTVDRSDPNWFMAQDLRPTDEIDEQ